MSESIMTAPTTKPPQSKYISKALLEIYSEMSSCGVTLKLHTDFDLYREVVSDITDRGAITSLFNPKKADIGPKNGFWIEGVDAEGHTVHVQAIRLDDLQNQSLASQWLEKPEWFAPPGVDVNLEKSNFNVAQASQEITGRICYHGDLWVHRSCRKFRLSPSLSKFAMMLAFIKFRPDFIYGFIVPKHIRQGLAAVHGYLHIHPWAPQWHINGSNELYDDYLVWVSGIELAELWTSGERDFEILGQIRKNGDGKLTIMKSVACH